MGEVSQETGFFCGQGFCQGLIGPMGTERTKAEEPVLNGGGRLLGLWS